MTSTKDTTWDTYFGKPVIPHERADNQLSHETYNLPKAYEGKNKHLEDVLDFMIRKEDEFYTSKLLPWSYTDELHVQWEIFRFNRTLMDVEPEQGIPRLVTAETENRSDNLLRRGLAFIIEHGFMTTDRGRRHFMMNLQQITDAVHTTAYFGVMHALLSTKQHYKSWLRETDRTAKKPRNLLRHERSNWACVQKTHKGLYVLDAELKHQMKKNGVVPNTWVFPPKMSIYLDMAPREQTEYRLKGPQAAGNLEDDRTGQGIRWRDTDVFEAATFDIDFVNDDHDLLQRMRQCGEFFLIPDGARAIKIFSADHDEFKTISYDHAYSRALNHQYEETTTELPLNNGSERKRITFGAGEEATQKFKQHVGNKISQLAGKILLDVQKKTGLKKQFALKFSLKNDEYAQKVQNVDSGMNNVKIQRLKREFAALGYTDIVHTFWCCSEADVEKHLQQILDMFEKEAQTLIKALTKDVGWDDIKELRRKIGMFYGFAKAKWAQDELGENFEIKTTKPGKDILIFRPFQTYRMSSAILAAGGKDLGETFHGHHDFQLSDDIIRKVHVGHYTHYSKSVVKQPKRYAIAEDVFAQGYVSGEGIDFFTEDSLREAFRSGEIGTPDCKPSLVAWVVDKGCEATVLDMMGEFSDQYSEYGASDFTYSARLKDLLLECDVNREGIDDDVFLSDQYVDNTLCFRGKQFTQRAEGAEFVCTSLGHGHWKGLTYSGCMNVREGTIMTTDHVQHQVGQSLVN
jgi:hypothetical protein